MICKCKGSHYDTLIININTVSHMQNNALNFSKKKRRDSHHPFIKSLLCLLPYGSVPVPGHTPHPFLHPAIKAGSRMRQAGTWGYEAELAQLTEELARAVNRAQTRTGLERERDNAKPFLPC